MPPVAAQRWSSGLSKQYGEAAFACDVNNNADAANSIAAKIFFIVRPHFGSMNITLDMNCGFVRAQSG
jgi:hypothetical protein